MEENLVKTCLHDRHVKQGALMSPFGGFDMPIQYTNITDEHNAVRQAVGVFDVSHMGEVRIKGPEAYKYVMHIFVGDVTGAPDGQIFYGMMCYENGGSAEGVEERRVKTAAARSRMAALLRRTLSRASVCLCRGDPWGWRLRRRCFR